MPSSAAASVPPRLRVLAAAWLACLLALVALAAPARADHEQAADPAAPGYEAPPSGGEWWDVPEEDVPVGDPEEDVSEVEEWDIPARTWTPPGGTPSRPASPSAPIPTGPTIAGKYARMRSSGKAAVPRGAPRRVRQVIAAANRIIGKPYKWGGGHGRLVDSGYDCSGAVSYALIRNGMLRSPLVSGALARWASKGAGRWITVYANRGHVYMEVAGLRLDTSPVGDPTGRRGVRWRPAIGRRPGFTARHLGRALSLDPPPRPGSEAW